MKIKILSVVLVLSLLLSSNATASFFSTTPTLTQVFALVSKLSDDIGLMADRILVMADNIGDMSDRIVHTEEMMADLTLDLAQNSNANSVDTVVISQNFQPLLYANEAPNFTTSSDAPQMLVYVSSSITMDTNSISVLVNNTDELTQHWSDLKALAQNNKIYVAIKTIDGNNISSLSNVLTYSTLY